MKRKSAFTEERNKNNFFKKIEKTETCWIWKGNINKEGYGKFWRKDKMKIAHRFSYELHKGEIPDGLQLDHLCRVRNCVNPDHLEPVTPLENIRRSPFFNGYKTHCKHGHEFIPENTKIMFDGHRECKICREFLKQKHLEISKEHTRLNPHLPKTHCIRGHELITSNRRKNNRACIKCSIEERQKISILVGPTRSKNHCINGHEYTPENTRINKAGYRMCISCHKKTANLPKQKDRTKCKNGHSYSLENIYMNSRGIKECRFCRRQRALLKQEKILKTKC